MDLVSSASDAPALISNPPKPSVLRLFPELFHEVLGSLDLHAPEEAHLPSCITISQVCRQWRDQARAYPELWTRIPVARLAWTQQALTYAVYSGGRHLPLTVHAVWGGSRNRWPNYDAMQLVAKECHRIGELRVKNAGNASTAPAVQRALKLFYGLAAPHLTNLSVEGGSFGAPLDRAFLSGGAPSLIYIEWADLYPTAGTLDFPILSPSPNVTYIHLAVDGLWSRLDAFHDGLTRLAPSLEYLSICTCELPAKGWSDPSAAALAHLPTIPPIVFPRVVECYLSDHIGRMGLLAGFLEFPNSDCMTTYSLALSVDDAGTQSRPILDVLAGESENIGAMVRRILDPLSLGDEADYDAGRIQSIDIDPCASEHQICMTVYTSEHGTHDVPSEIHLTFEWSPGHPLRRAHRGLALASIIRHLPQIDGATSVYQSVKDPEYTPEDAYVRLDEPAAHGWLEISSVMPNVDYVMADGERADALISQLAATPHDCFPGLCTLVIRRLDFSAHDTTDQRILRITCVLRFRLWRASTGIHPALEVTFEDCVLTKGQGQRLVAEFGKYCRFPGGRDANRWNEDALMEAVDGQS
ncbi:hypothetical protein OF83DRAFT_200052 [Amylostereum chailletii]|nr:hypothetical protein OF83DRAFT_200052 [Amylostereum chailletii]